MKKKVALFVVTLVALVICGRAVLTSEVLASHIIYSFNPASLSFTPGQSVLGPGALIPNLIIGQPVGGDVVYIKELGTDNIYYGANSTGVENDLPNGCMPKDYGIADTTRVHDYSFTFTDNQTASEFTLRYLDWGDYLPFGACTNGQCGATMTAYDASNNVIDTDSVTFTTDASGLSRPTPEFGHTRVYGDACTGVGALGSRDFSVSGSGIARITFGFNNAGSRDPNSAIGDIYFALEHADPTPAPTPADMCANIDGVQTTVPTDYHLDASQRNCVQWELGGPSTGSSGASQTPQVLGAATTNGTKSVLGVTNLANTGSAEILNLAFTFGAVSLGFGVTTKFRKS